MRVTAILPSFNPDERLLCVVEGLQTAGFSDIVVVNDGSDIAHAVQFEPLMRLSGSLVRRKRRV